MDVESVFRVPDLLETVWRISDSDVESVWSLGSMPSNMVRCRTKGQIRTIFISGQIYGQISPLGQI